MTVLIPLTGIFLYKTQCACNKKPSDISIRRIILKLRELAPPELGYQHLSGKKRKYTIIRNCTTIHRYPIFSTRYSVMCKVYTGYCGTSEIEHGLCACTVDNPLAKARGLSLRTGAQTMLYLSFYPYDNSTSLMHTPILEEKVLYGSILCCNL